MLHAVTGDPATLVPDEEVHPPQLPASTYHALQKAAYVDGGQIAAAVAERALGEDVVVTTDGIMVAGVAPDSPAAAVLQPGDVVTAVDGEALTSVDDLVRAVQSSAGGALTLAVRGRARTSTP